MPSAINGLETELKFELDSAAAAQLKTHPALAELAPARGLHTIYFDTPQHDLKNSGVSLRVRACNGGYVQTIKRRRGGRMFDRDEWECVVTGGEPDLDAFGKTPAAGMLNGHADELGQVFATRVDRRIHFWRQDGNVVEVSLDEGEIVIGDRHEPIHELELELKAGEPSALFDLARELAAIAPMRLSFESKGERGYRLAGHDGAAAIKADRTALGASMTAGEAFRRVGRSTLMQISANAELLQRARAPEALHQTRVGLRRLRAALAAFRPIVADKSFAHIHAEARWLARELDEARDIDVFMQATVGLAREDNEADPALAALSERLRRTQADAYQRALGAIASPRFSALLLDTAAWVEVGPWTSRDNALRDRPVAGFGAATLSGLHQKFRKAGGRLAKLDPAERHRLRIRAKKLRYAAEFFGGAFAKRPARRQAYLEALKAVQERLGDLNDLAVARTLGPRFVGQRSGELAFTAGLIVGRRERAEPVLLRAARRAFAAFLKAKPFWND